MSLKAIYSLNHDSCGIRNHPRTWTEFCASHYTNEPTSKTHLTNEISNFSISSNPDNGT